MRLLEKLGLAAAACLLVVNVAVADTTVKWLHIEVNPAQVKIWEDVARAYEASHPGVKIEMQFLENEAYKAKLPTILQSKDRPNIIYSWAGGVLKTQIEAGVLEDITDQVKGYSDSLTPAALAAFTSNGRVYGLPIALSQVGFLCNKELMVKAKVDPAAIKTWDDLLAAVKTLKAAGVTPIVVGGADKWPLHFYWTHLAVRIGGKAAFDAALRDENGGFAGETFQKSGELFKQLVELQPFQNGFLGFKNPQAVGYFGDGKAAMTLAISSAYNLQRALAADKVGLSEDKICWFDFPVVAGGKGEPTDTLGGITGWLVTKGSPKEAVDFLKYFISKDVQTRLAAGSYIIPVVQGAEAGLNNSFMKMIAANLAKSQYHQNFYDQSLGPSVGRVVNDVSAEIAGGSMSPQDAAKAIEAAFKQGN
ncbi:extracellular solute-binding protein [Bradyrhizobium guangdongense]|uniref:ABC transporter substrate-binding protein n=1 Tax=Bradyrhizobium guangdongense TaxID=1325090 RepID=A0A410V249_9BRAD|nr:extracellular solute-binding protein [Bradyrhizobium guangdongense]QAU37725.1 carbohydrate ABC transporter substrate-binding protein [Bradyrhizobium guangdongense]QOZ58782.1 carbohydrate ABC transporter substrate-binding protein [Bradyrhizobium guangdongense]GGI19687.1 ABC transporter substrate-binding protein [Bradyrhizobium guangdongense]